MKIELTYTELMEYLRKHVGREVELSYVSEKTVRVVTEVEYRLLRRHTLDVDVNISLDGIDGTDLFLSYMFLSSSMDTLVRGSLPLLRSKISEKLPMIEMLNGNNMVVQLNKVSQLRDALNIIEIKDIYLNANNISLTLKLK